MYTKHQIIKCIALIVFTIATLPLCTHTTAVASQSIDSFLQKQATETADYTIGELFLSDNPSAGVVILEDAHCNVSIQKQLMKIIKSLNQAIQISTLAGIPLILQEGGMYGPIDTSVLQLNKTKEELTHYLDQKLHAGEIGAAEYLHTEEGGFTFCGIEDTTLYEANYQHFMNVSSKREKIQALLDEIQEKLKGLQTVLFSAELQDFYQLMHEEIKGETIEEYLETLRLLMLQYGIDEQRFKTLATYFETVKALSSLNKELVEKELEDFNQICKKKHALDEVYSNIANGSITIGEYPELYKYGKLKHYVLSTRMVDFIKEKEALENELFMHLAYHEEEKELIYALRSFHIIHKILSLTLTRDEYRYYAQEPKKGRNLFRELIEYIQSYYHEFTTSLPLDEIERDAQLFYKAVEERDNSLTANVAKALREYNIPIATLIIGGFHTDGIISRLKEQNISFLVVTPKLENIEQGSVETYFDVMKRFWNQK
ncbi:MAG: hypothetical protein KKH94_06795 [Candidatus Omnitrophica bacterium]|nr:hypothetical protein [Candidatus Omnitrophota bacterium]